MPSFSRPKHSTILTKHTAAWRVWGRPSAHERPTLPAGHPISWGLLTDGTALDGSEYPHPVFLDYK